MAVKRSRVSIDLGEELYAIAKQEAEQKYLSVGVYLRMLVAERITQLKARRSKNA